MKTIVETMGNEICDVKAHEMKTEIVTSTKKFGHGKFKWFKLKNEIKR